MELIYGKYLEGLENEVFRLIKQALDTQEKTLVIVPAQAMFLMEDQIIKRCGVKGFFSLEVVSFERLTDKLFEKEGGRAAERMSLSGAAMLVKRAIEEKKSELKVMAKEGIDMHEAAAKMLLALKAEDFTPESIRELAEVSAGATRDKLWDMAVLYERMLSYRREGVWDGHDAEEHARGLIAKSELARNARVIIHGFDVLPASRVRTVCELLKAGCRVYVTLEADETDEVFKRQNRAMKALEGAARAAGAPFEKIKIDESGKKSADIAHIESCLYEYPTRPFAGDIVHIQLIRAENRMQETEHAAGAILKAAGSGVSLSDIGVLMGAPEEYLPFIEDIFTRAGIPFFYEGKRSLSTHPLAVFAMSAARLATGREFSRRDAERHIKAGYLAVSQEETDKLLRYVREHGRRGSFFRCGGKGTPEEIEDIRSRAFSGIAELKSATAGEDAAGLAGLLLRYMRSLDAEEKTLELVAELEDARMEREARFFSQAWARTSALLEQAELLLKGMQASELTGVMKAGFESADIAVVPPLSNEVTIGDVTHSIFPHRRLMLILGANEGSLPAQAGGGLFSEYEVERLNERAFFPGHIAIEDQRLFLRRAFTSAECLYISYSVENGPAALIVERLKKLFPGLSESEGAKPLTEGVSLMALAGELREAIDGEPRDARLAAEYLVSPSGREKLQLLMSAALFDNGARAIGGLAGDLYAHSGASVSRVETFFRCPYKHFLRYGLRPADLKERQEDPLSSGSYVHALIESVSRRASEKGFDKTSDDDIALMVEEAALAEREEHNKGIFADSMRYSVTEEYLKEEAKRALLSVKEQLSGGARLMDTEKDLGRRLLIETPVGKVALTGRIDRVDELVSEGESYARVIDYKTGKHGFNVRELFKGTDIQLAVYLLALMEAADMKPGGAYYMNVSLDYSLEGESRELPLNGFALSKFTEGRKKGLSQEQIDLLLEHTRELLGQAASGIAAGENAISPVNEDNCRSCEYAGICRFDERYAGNVCRKDAEGERSFMEEYTNAADRQTDESR